MRSLMEKNCSSHPHLLLPKATLLELSSDYKAVISEVRY